MQEGSRSVPGLVDQFGPTADPRDGAVCPLGVTQKVLRGVLNVIALFKGHLAGTSVLRSSTPARSSTTTSIGVTANAAGTLPNSTTNTGSTALTVLLMVPFLKRRDPRAE